MTIEDVYLLPSGEYWIGDIASYANLPDDVFLAISNCLHNGGKSPTRR
jgi:hypothetical protein